MGFNSLEEIGTVHSKVGSIPEFRKHFEAWEEGSESAVENQTNLLLEAADYSPEIEPSKSERKTARIFELRVYHSPTYRQLGALHERFAGPEIRIFHRHEIPPAVLHEHSVRRVVSPTSLPDPVREPRRPREGLGRFRCRPRMDQGPCRVDRAQRDRSPASCRSRCIRPPPTHRHNRGSVMALPQSAADFLRGHTERLRSQAKKKRLVFPEGYDPRIVAAADKLVRDQLVTPVLVGKRSGQRPGRSGLR